MQDTEKNAGDIKRELDELKMLGETEMIYVDMTLQALATIMCC